MDNVQEVNVQRIMEQIKEKLGKRRQEAPPIDAAPPPADGQMETDLSVLHSSHDIYRINLSSHRKILGPFVVALKKIIRQLLTPSLERQVAYNASNARVVTSLKEHLVSLGQQQAQSIQAVRAEIAILEQQQGRWREEVLAAQGQARQEILAAQAQALQAVQEKMEGMSRHHIQELQLVRERTSRTEGKLRRILFALSNGHDGGEQIKIERKNLTLQAFEASFDSLGFGERFWGSEAELKERRRIYVDFYHGCDEVLDVGCGRGEFLELLRVAGIRARGVDPDLDMTLLCQEKGLDVIREDGFAYLESMPDASLGGVFAAQVVEHLEPNQIIELVRLCHRKLRSGGVLIMETPNPLCLMIFAQCFYMDFTHTRPVHPEALKFLAESLGFQHVTLRFTSSVDPSLRIPLLNEPGPFGPQAEQFNRSIAYLNDLLYGYQDYAVIAKK